MAKDYLCESDYRPHVPDGKYEAVCIGYDKSFVMGKARKLFLNFRIIDHSSHHGKEIFMAFNIPYNQKIKPGSKYYKTWTQVNDDRPPTRNAKLSPVIFKGRIFRIKTRTVKPLYLNGKKMPEDYWYSVVDYIDEIIEGKKDRCSSCMHKQGSYCEYAERPLSEMKKCPLPF